MEALDPHNKKLNNKLAFDAAASIGVSRIIEPDDMVCFSIDLSIFPSILCIAICLFVCLSILHWANYPTRRTLIYLNCQRFFSICIVSMYSHISLLFLLQVYMRMPDKLQIMTYLHELRSHFSGVEITTAAPTNSQRLASIIVGYCNFFIALCISCIRLCTVIVYWALY